MYTVNTHTYIIVAEVNNAIHLMAERIQKKNNNNNKYNIKNAS